MQIRFWLLMMEKFGLGTHEELLKSNAMYKETFEAQNNGGDFDEQ